jgi:hypothetical protein
MTNTLKRQLKKNLLNHFFKGKLTLVKFNLITKVHKYLVNLYKE